MGESVWSCAYLAQARRRRRGCAARIRRWRPWWWGCHRDLRRAVTGGCWSKYNRCAASSVRSTAPSVSSPGQLLLRITTSAARAGSRHPTAGGSGGDRAGGGRGERGGGRWAVVGSGTAGGAGRWAAGGGRRACLGALDQASAVGEGAGRRG